MDDIKISIIGKQTIEIKVYPGSNFLKNRKNERFLYIFGFEKTTDGYSYQTKEVEEAIDELIKRFKKYKIDLTDPNVEEIFQKRERIHQEYENSARLGAEIK